jgi:hypothetical protein
VLDNVLFHCTLTAEHVSKHVKQSRNKVIIINFPTQLHFVGNFYKICIILHRFMNINFPSSVAWDEISWDEVKKYKYSHYWPCSDSSVIFKTGLLC